MAQRLVRFTPLDINFINIRLRPQRLDHRIAALDHAIGLGAELVFSFVRHRYLSYVKFVKIRFADSIPQLFPTIKMIFKFSYRFGKKLLQQGQIFLSNDERRQTLVCRLRLSIKW